MTEFVYKIKIKDLLNEDASNQTVLSITEKLLPQLKRVVISTNKRIGITKEGNYKENLEWCEQYLEEIIDDFEFVASGIKDNDSSASYEFISWCEAFNEYLRKLYDLGDTLLKRSDNYAAKYLWVG